MLSMYIKINVSLFVCPIKTQQLMNNFIKVISIDSSRLLDIGVILRVLGGCWTPPTFLIESSNLY